MRIPLYNKLTVVFGPRPPISWIVLCVVCFVVLVKILASSSYGSLDLANSDRTLDIFTNYRKLKEQATVEYLELRSLSLGARQQQELGLCGKERENFVPCYNISANLLAGYKDGEEFDRHCELSEVGNRCLVRPPKDYKPPLKWPTGRDIIWSGNVKITKDQFLSSGSMTKRMMLLEENQIAFHADDGSIFDGVKDYSHQLAEMIGLGSDTELFQAGVRTVLDIGCGFGSFGAHLLSLKIMTVCVAAYEVTGSQVQLSLERGLPAMIANFFSRQLPYPTLSFDMVHCARCGIVWDEKGVLFLLEVDRVLKPGGYFVLTSPSTKDQGGPSDARKRDMFSPLDKYAEDMCWTLLAQQDETSVWQKTADLECYKSRKNAIVQPCKGHEEDHQPYYQPLLPCISCKSSKRWIPIQNRSAGPNLSPKELKVHGKCYFVPLKYLLYFLENQQFWRSSQKNYWSLLTPLIFSDHPKRPGDEDPLPPFNMIRNVMDMNAHYGGLNSAFLDENKAVWVMNVVPVGAPNTLPLILDQGFAGVLHDWCEPFPTYPRTYDLLHASGLVSYLNSEKCSMMDVLLEMDRILRPEGWIILSDKVGAIEMARMLASQIRWEALGWPRLSWLCTLFYPRHWCGDQSRMVRQRAFIADLFSIGSVEISGMKAVDLMVGYQKQRGVILLKRGSAESLGA
ncbi:hypothetical protein MLD38_004339 [Melastoma candidum]|uniref:Uncharacterized protein n=1 Tax=Melastoma candidum TaxID=119954 RepID=A0ACB9SDY8_9MYRT|nr:hypothetical protein MLD38_004339 [Melastoma candidum]